MILVELCSPTSPHPSLDSMATVWAVVDMNSEKNISNCFFGSILDMIVCKQRREGCGEIGIGERQNKFSKPKKYQKTIIDQKVKMMTFWKNVFNPCRRRNSNPAPLKFTQDLVAETPLRSLLSLWGCGVFIYLTEVRSVVFILSKRFPNFWFVLPKAYPKS